MTINNLVSTKNASKAQQLFHKKKDMKNYELINNNRLFSFTKK